MRFKIYGRQSHPVMGGWIGTMWGSVLKINHVHVDEVFL